jgi:hypothetical protein
VNEIAALGGPLAGLVPDAVAKQLVDKRLARHTQKV